MFGTGDIREIRNEHYLPPRIATKTHNFGCEHEYCAECPTLADAWSSAIRIRVDCHIYVVPHFIPKTLFEIEIYQFPFCNCVKSISDSIRKMPVDILVMQMVIILQMLYTLHNSKLTVNC